MKKDRYLSMIIKLLFALYDEHVFAKKDKRLYFGRLYLWYKDNHLVLSSSTRRVNLKVGRRVLKHNYPSPKELSKLLPSYGFYLLNTKTSIGITYCGIDLALIQPNESIQN